MKNTGPIHFSGGYHDLVFYYLNGKAVVRRKGLIPKSVLKNDPKYFRFQRQSIEFGQVQRLGKQIRRMLICGQKYIRDIPGDNQLNRILGHIKNNGTGRDKRVRDFDFRANSHLLENLEFHSEWKVRELINSKFLLNSNSERNEVTLDFPLIDPGKEIKAPREAAFFKINFRIGVLCNYKYLDDKYMADTYREMPLQDSITSGLISLNTSMPLQLTASIPGNPVLTSNETLLAAMGVEFLTADMARIKTHCGMSIIGIW